MKKLLTTLDEGLDKITTALMVVGCVVMTLTVLINAACRYIFHFNFSASEEITMIAAMYLYFFGMIYAERRDDEICADMVTLFTKNPVIIAFMRILKHGISFVICVIGTTWVWDFIMQTVKLKPRFTVTKWPQMIYRLPMLICFVFMSVYLFAHFVRAIIHFKNIRAREEDNAL